jgi:uncharacterized damage-inducible protein DinB
MNLSSQIAKQFRGVHFGGNWTDVNLKETLKNVDYQQATAKVGNCNTIASLVFHINYFISAVLKVLKGGPLDAHDKFSFDLPPIGSQKDWEALLEKTWREAEEFAKEVEHLPEDKLDEVFSDPKYGTYYTNLQGIIEHTHYHLGQIVILKKLTGSSAI